MNKLIDEQLSGLSGAAKRVAGLTIAGKSSKEIADLTGTTDKNIRMIRSRIYKKFGIKTHRELVMKVMNNDLYQNLIGQLNLEVKNGK